MVLCCPSATLGGHVWWNILQQDQYFIVQQHKIGPPIWNPPFRILLKCNSYIVAEAKSKDEVEKDLTLCQSKIQEALKERNNQQLSNLSNELSTFFHNLWKVQQEVVILSSAMGNQTSSPGQSHGTNSGKPTTPRKVSNVTDHKTETPKTETKTTTKVEDPKRKEPDTKKEEPKKEEKPKTPPASSKKEEEKPLDTASTAKLDHTPEESSHMSKVPSNPDMLQWAKQQFDQLGEKAEEVQKQAISAESATDSIPLELDPEDIKLGEFLGEGVYSEVYKGYCYGTQVAVKKFKNQGFDPEVLKEVRKEVRIMKSLHHPNLLLFLGACTKPGHLMIVTELMEKSFHEISQSKVDLFTKLKMAKEAAKGMSWLHSLSPAIIHRDLKPENILVNQSRRAVKIADFGLSLVKDHSKQEAEEMKRIRGSPAFMSPEALLGNDLTPKTDVYSFGMILWELLTGKSPYDDLSIESFEQLIEEICEKGTREKIPEDCPPAFRKLIESCWAPLPEQRPSFLQLITQLDECILEVAIADKEGRRMWKRHFTEANMLKAEVTWEAFLSAVSLTLRMSPGLKIFQGLKSMMVRENSAVVSIDEYGNILKWFGPMMNPNDQEDNFVYKMQNLLTKRWFHGDISLQDAQARLAGTEPGTFLIRFSSNPGQYALSKMIENQNKDHVIVHIRISHSPGGKYSFVLDGKVYEFGNLDELVKSSVLNLGKACPGSKYYAQFRIKQVHSGYVNTVNN